MRLWGTAFRVDWEIGPHAILGAGIRLFINPVGWIRKPLGAGAVITTEGDVIIPCTSGNHPVSSANLFFELDPEPSYLLLGDFAVAELTFPSEMKDGSIVAITMCSKWRSGRNRN